MSYIRKEDYSPDRARPNLLAPYVAQMTVHLKRRFPQASEEQIDAFIKQTVRERFAAPIVEAVVHKREGYSKHIELPLDQYVREHIADNNLSPSGSCYMPVSRRESFLRRSIEAKIKARNDFKKLYLTAEANGQKRESQYYNQNQANSKIFNNAIAGGMKIKQFILGSRAGFNAITSVGRICVKQGYSFIERAVNGNLYLPTSRDAVSYIYNHVRAIPPEFVDMIGESQLYIPTVDDVYTYLKTSVEHYVLRIDHELVYPVLQQLSDIELAYVFYAGCFTNLCRYNKARMKAWIASCFVLGPVDPALYADIDPGSIKSFREDVVACMLSTNYQRLGRHPEKDAWNSLKDAAKFNPEGLKEFIYVTQHFVDNFEKMVPVLRPILQITTTFAKLTEHHRMARRTVPLSDTDSNIFSNQELIRWYRGQIDFQPEAFAMNALTTFLLSQSLEHVFAKLSSGLGIENKDVTRISMKNEFLYPVLIQSALGKHYLAIAIMQEGSLLPTPRRDIKGVNFRNSKYPRDINTGFSDFVVKLVDKILEGKPIRAMEILGHVANLEHTIYQSLKARESTYLQTETIKRREEYADPTISQYFYYELWTEVFAQDYGDMILPNKCFKIPLRGGKKLFKDPVFLENLQKTNPRVHKKLLAFLARYPKRELSYILVPPFKGEVHPFFADIFDARDHISQVLSAYYIMLDSLGIGTVDRRASSLVSDFCDPSREMLV